MGIIQVYKCFCDELRLRILNLLREGPLCVCHLVEILDCDQVKMSKQLRYMKELGMVEGERRAQWMVYRLAEPNHPLLVENLKCLQDCAGEHLSFGNDLRKRAAVVDQIADACDVCTEVKRAIMPSKQAES
jgi:ArsR family transcriptional regulator, arsenate/arsenite/antimonite-responsive transcriptional repressor